MLSLNEDIDSPRATTVEAVWLPPGKGGDNPPLNIIDPDNPGTIWAMAGAPDRSAVTPSTSRSLLMEIT